jgi:hypothetical protein
LSFFIRDSLARVTFPAFRLPGKLHSLRFIRILKRRAKACPSNKGKTTLGLSKDGKIRPRAGSAPPTHSTPT